MRTIRYRPKYDAQITFQTYSGKKKIITDLVGAGKFGCMGDVIRRALDEFIDNHNLETQDEQHDG